MFYANRNETINIDCCKKVELSILKTEYKKNAMNKKSVLRVKVLKYVNYGHITAVAIPG